MLWAMSRSSGKKGKTKKVEEVVPTGTKSRPRTVRLPYDDETWVDSQGHPQGFSGVLVDAVRFYREHKDEQRKALLGAVL